MAITDIGDGDILTGTIYQTIIDTVENTDSGHQHDGSDSKVVAIENISGGKVEVLAAETGANSDGSDVVLDSYSFSANELGAGDFLVVRYTCRRPDAGGAVEFTLNATDTSATGDIVTLGTINQNTNGGGVVHLCQRPDASDVIWAVGSHCNGGAVSEINDGLDTNDSDVFTTAWTLNFKANPNSEGLHWRWVLYRVAAP
jgi:hypothetical protein